MKFERFILALFLLWLAAACAVMVVRGAEKLPMPPEAPAGTVPGCAILGVTNDSTVAVQDVKKPRLSWILRLFTNNWKGVTVSRDTREHAWRDCVRWQNAVQAQVRAHVN